jgi:hypothetical protein
MFWTLRVQEKDSIVFPQGGGGGAKRRERSFSRSRLNAGAEERAPGNAVKNLAAVPGTFSTAAPVELRTLTMYVILKTLIGQNMFAIAILQ